MASKPAKYCRMIPMIEDSKFPVKKAETKAALPLLERAALSPSEFASLFGREETWGYRQIYSGKVQVLTDLKSTLIPIDEIKKLLEKRSVYSGRKNRRGRGN